jgi:hypothetical protein
MLCAVGPWTFEVLDLTTCGGLVEGTWRQTGTVVEHGWARYRVEGSRAAEYCIELHHDVVSP